VKEVGHPTSTPKVSCMFIGFTSDFVQHL